MELPPAEAMQEVAAPAETALPPIPAEHPSEASAFQAQPMPVAAPVPSGVQLMNPVGMAPAPQMPPAMSHPGRIPHNPPSPAVPGTSGMMPPHHSMGGCLPSMMASEQPLMAPGGLPAQGPLPGGLPLLGSAGPPASVAPYRQLKVEDALAYLDQVKMKFEKQPHIYNQFLDIMKEFKAQSIDTPGVIDRVLQLFHGHRELILGFNTFLPPGYKIEFTDDENKPRVQLKYPHGVTGPQPQGYGSGACGQPGPGAPPLPVPPQPSYPPGSMPGGYAPVPPMPDWGQPQQQAQQAQVAQHQPEQAAAASAQPQPKKAPIEFDQAINYVTKIKTRFAKQPETYKAFLEILHTYQKEQRTIKEVYEQVSTLFKNHTDLLAEFSQFLPDGNPDAPGGTGGMQLGVTKTPKGKALGPEARGGVKPVAQRPGGKFVPRPAGAEEEDERFWSKGKAGKARVDGVKGRPEELRAPANRSPEAEFFSKCRSRMPKNLYLELLKCLNLYSQQILERSELFTLVHDLFKRSEIGLFTSFRRLLGYQGGETTDAPSPPQSKAPIAEGGSFRDLDFASMKKHGTSYRILPDSYELPPCSGRGPLEQLVLNDSWVSVPTGTEDLNFKTMRKNQYEEAIFRAEDERFELDTAIETNTATLTYLLPLEDEIGVLTEPEKRRFRLPSGLSAMHCKSLRRLYGTQGSQVIELLLKCPAAAISQVTRRLQQKDAEWRSQRASLSKGWKEVYEKNWTKSLDHRSFYFKQGDKKNFSGKQMVLELKALTEGEKEADGDKAEGAAAARPAEASSTDGALHLPFKISQPLSPIHDETLGLMTFAAKLSFSLIPEAEIGGRVARFWDALVRPFFSCPELELAGAARPTASAGGTKPLVIVAAEYGEDEATREARPPEERHSMPLSYPKTSGQLLLGNSHLYIFIRLYHIVLDRLAAAREMASKASQASGDDGAIPNGLSALPAGSAEQEARRQAIAKLKEEAGGDLYRAFLAALRQLVEAKLEASTYEDILRTLLGSNAYILFTLHKILSQALKQLQMLLVEDTSRRLLELYAYERQRVALGSMCEGTYRNNCRRVLEGDDAFRMEQAYTEGGGELTLSFLRERDADDDEEESEDEADEEEEEEEAAGGEGGAAWAQYMDSFVEVHRAPKRTRPALVLSRLLKRQVAVRPRPWQRGVLLNGLECRAALGSCKLRFAHRSEDLWYAAPPAPGAKRAARAESATEAKRQKLHVWLKAQPREPGSNALSGMSSSGPVRLPNASTWQPKPIEP